jgi:hypothetical protein
MIVEARRETGAGCMELEVGENTAQQLSLFGGSMQERADMNKEVEAADAALASDVNQLFARRVSVFLQCMESNQRTSS